MEETELAMSKRQQSLTACWRRTSFRPIGTSGKGWERAVAHIAVAQRFRCPWLDGEMSNLKRYIGGLDLLDSILIYLL